LFSKKLQPIFFPYAVPRQNDYTFCTRGSQKVMPPFFISCNLQVEHMEISDNITTPLPKAELFFNIVSKFVNILPSLNKSMYSCLVKVALSPLQTLVHNIQQYLCTGIMVSLQAFSERPHR
jgi:hypothetical protein